MMAHAPFHPPFHARLAPIAFAGVQVSSVSVFAALALLLACTVYCARSGSNGGGTWRLRCGARAPRTSGGGGPLSAFVGFPVPPGSISVRGPGVEYERAVCIAQQRVALAGVRVRAGSCCFATVWFTTSYMPPFRAVRQNITDIVQARAHAYLVQQGSAAAPLLPGWYDGTGRFIACSRQAMLTLLMLEEPGILVQPTGDVTAYSRTQLGVYVGDNSFERKADVMLYSKGAYVVADMENPLNIPGFAYAVSTAIDGVGVVVMGNPLASKGCFVNRGSASSNNVEFQLFFVWPDKRVEAHLSPVTKRKVAAGQELLLAYGPGFATAPTDAALASYFASARTAVHRW